VSTCPENLEVLLILHMYVKEMSGISVEIRELSGEKSCQGKLLRKFAENYVIRLFVSLTKYSVPII